MPISDSREAWDREYREVRAYTTSYRLDLDRGVRFLLAYLESRGEPVGEPIVDCGCGRGRNALPLAEAGHRVIGLEHSGEALDLFRRDLAERDVDELVILRQHDLREPLPLEDGAAGLVLDVTAVDNLVGSGDRRRYGAEVGRILRPGGRALVVTFARDDGYYGRWLAGSPSADQGVVEDPNTGIRNRLFAHDELDAVFAPALAPEVRATLVFVDEAAAERWTRRFLMHLYRKRASG